MSHRHIQDRMILYLDGELSEQDMIRVRDHLDQCPRCLRYFESFTAVWRQEPARPAPPPYLWTRVNARIRETERPTPVLTDLLQRLALLARPAMLLATLFVGILIGSYLGNIPVEAPDDANARVAVQENEDIFSTSYPESFNDPELVGLAYMIVDNEDR